MVFFKKLLTVKKGGYHVRFFIIPAGSYPNYYNPV
jgi:hypothetical protein